MIDSGYVPPKPTRWAPILLFVVLFALWLIWSGHYTVDWIALFAHDTHGEEGHHPVVNTMILTLGLLSCSGVVLLCRRMGIVDNETIPLVLMPRLVRYVPWLAWQVVLANLDVIRRILLPKSGERAEKVVVAGHQHTDVARATFANSITLTPGTVTIDVVDGVFTVHALTTEAVEDLLKGEMDRQVTRLEGSA